ncbi:MAG: ATP-binding protein [Vicingaceae bacterium]|nr:ATP-binding protein [Vicingaceae bacterium]
MIQGGISQHIELSSEVESISKIENFIDRVSDQYQFGEDHYGNILIALTEAVNNAITHGNKLDPNKKVHLNMATTSKHVEFIVKDEGVGFDYDNVPDPTLPENIEKIRGRGIFLMKTLADRVDFEENGRIIKLNFSISNN